MYAKAGALAHEQLVFANAGAGQNLSLHPTRDVKQVRGVANWACTSANLKVVVEAGGACATP